MNPKNIPADLSPVTVTEIKAGVHQGWECMLHEWEAQQPIPSCDMERLLRRSTFVDSLFRTKGWVELNRKRSCGICALLIAESILEQRDPFAVDPVLKAAFDASRKKSAKSLSLVERVRKKVAANGSEAGV